MRNSSSHGAVSTDFRVRRWDAEQVDWTLGRLGVQGRQRNKANVVIGPGTFAELGVAPYSDTTDRDCNLVVQAGWVALIGGIAATSIVNKFSATFGRIGAGTVTTAAAYSDVKLGGDTGGSSTTSYYQACMAAPTIVTSSAPPSMAFTATFGTGVANFSWQEFCIDNYSASGVTTTGLSNVILLNHGISNQGAKVAGQVWTATATLNFGYPSGSGTVS